MISGKDVMETDLSNSKVGTKEVAKINSMYAMVITTLGFLGLQVLIDL